MTQSKQNRMHLGGVFVFQVVYFWLCLINVLHMLEWTHKCAWWCLLRHFSIVIYFASDSQKLILYEGFHVYKNVYTIDYISGWANVRWKSEILMIERTDQLYIDDWVISILLSLKIKVSFHKRSINATNTYWQIAYSQLKNLPLYLLIASMNEKLLGWFLFLSLLQVNLLRSIMEPEQFQVSSAKTTSNSGIWL